MESQRGRACQAEGAVLACESSSALLAVGQGHRPPLEASSGASGARCEVGVLDGVGDRYRYMFTTLQERSDAIDARIRRLSDDIVEQKTSSLQIMAVGVPQQVRQR
eukprot:scaffold529_cov308-Pinguiococcus_pyrenoidosus.AAC.62